MSIDILNLSCLTTNHTHLLFSTDELSAMGSGACASVEINQTLKLDADDEWNAHRFQM